MSLSYRQGRSHSLTYGAHGRTPQILEKNQGVYIYITELSNFAQNNYTCPPKQNLLNKKKKPTKIYKSKITRKTNG